ncbi:MAG: response regulator [Clostridiales bacterium]|nr:response regulator [Clostridiales bacterium]
MKYSAILVDDEIWTRTALKKLGNWNELGIEIIAEASDGEYGLELIIRLCPDIIITDVKMPYINGLELIKILRERGNGAKVIFVSGYDDFDFIRRAMKLQAVDYLLKPIKKEELNEQLQKCVDEIKLHNDEANIRQLDLQGFINVQWLGEYYKLRDSVYEGLYSNNQNVLEQSFAQITDFLCTKQDSSFSKSLAICIYYDLHNGLQRYIFESGNTIEDIFPNNEGMFVFSTGFSFADMLKHIKSLYLSAKTNIEKLARKKSKVDISLIQQYINANYCNGITLDETAEKFFISKEYLSKIFKQLNGLSFSEYVLKLRMEKAKELLTVKKVPIKDIAQLTGYADQVHFHKAFKKYFGVTPGYMQKDKD